MGLWCRAGPAADFGMLMGGTWGLGRPGLVVACLLDLDMTGYGVMVVLEPVPAH